MRIGKGLQGGKEFLLFLCAERAKASVARRFLLARGWFIMSESKTFNSLIPTARQRRFPMTQKDAKPTAWDPVYLHAFHEMRIIWIVWLIGLLWTVPYCYLNGYPEQFDPEAFSTTWGVPSWLFWGVAAPWAAACAAATWFCFGVMKDDDLGEAPEDAE